MTPGDISTSCQQVVDDVNKMGLIGAFTVELAFHSLISCRCLFRPRSLNIKQNPTTLSRAIINYKEKGIYQQGKRIRGDRCNP